MVEKLETAEVSNLSVSLTPEMPVPLKSIAVSSL